MSTEALNQTLTATWQRAEPVVNRWQVLQTHLSKQASLRTDASAWARRSFVICKWRALPASVSARAI